MCVPVHIILHVHLYEFEIWNDREYVRDCLRDVYLFIYSTTRRVLVDSTVLIVHFFETGVTGEAPSPGSCWFWP